MFCVNGFRAGMCAEISRNSGKSPKYGPIAIQRAGFRPESTGYMIEFRILETFF